MITLVDAYTVTDAPLILYALLKERKPEESISHRYMPTLTEHRAFFRDRPYKHWYLIQNGSYAGAIYLSRNNEIGISIFERCRRHGYAAVAIRELNRLHPGPKLANINPMNLKSIKLFEKFDAKLLQLTYQLK